MKETKGQYILMDNAEFAIWLHQQTITADAWLSFFCVAPAAKKWSQAFVMRRTFYHRVLFHYEPLLIDRLHYL